MLKTLRYDSFQAGTHLLILGAVHGNEKCGTKGIMRLIEEIDAGKINLISGKLTLVPICNPRAYDENKRFIERNLNRRMYPKDIKKDYEDNIDPILCPIIESADIMLDLHSYESAGNEFGFLGHETRAELDFCLNLGVENFVYGWSEAFSKAASDPRESMGTTEYAREFNIPAVTIECGQHLNMDAPEIAYRTILYALKYCGLIDECPFPPVTSHSFTKMQTVFYKKRAGEWTRPFKHYDIVKKDEVLAVYEDGEKIIAPHDGVIILPKSEAKIDGEWFYFGVKTQCPEVV